MSKTRLAILLVFLVHKGPALGAETQFPDDFLFGTATSAHQIEGAWNTNGKGESIWDHYTHTQPDLVEDHTNADVACDSYHNYKEDVRLLKDLNVQFYRFSLAWTRILPNGLPNKINEDGINYYNALIDELRRNGIAPVVTLFHWDTPQHLQELGGFANSLMVRWFQDYAKVAFTHFGDRVQYWITFNEPRFTCDYNTTPHRYAPGLNSDGVGNYLCAHNLLKAHAEVYHLYQDLYKAEQKGSISISLDSHWYEPATPSKSDTEAAQRILDFTLGWFADPIYSTMGDYPQTMKDRVAMRSKKEGFHESRLPSFTPEEIKRIRGTSDFFCLNHYTSFKVRNVEEAEIGGPSYAKDRRGLDFSDPDWPQTDMPWLKVVPWGLRKLLNYIKSRYGDVGIWITENGACDGHKINDFARITYFKEYLNATLSAIHEDKINVKGYTAWSLMDNFEWLMGYQIRFGLYFVDFQSANRTRTPKASAIFYKELIKSRKIPEEAEASFAVDKGANFGPPIKTEKKRVDDL